MKFLCMFDMKENVAQSKVAETIARRSEYHFPEGSKLIAEYWTPAQSPTVVAIVEAEDAAPLLQNSVAWLDVFDCRVIPVIEWKEGAQKLAKAFKK